LTGLRPAPQHLVRDVPSGEHDVVARDEGEDVGAGDGARALPLHSLLRSVDQL
jgi:hypothetical protein